MTTVFLKVKNKHLTEESKIIRHEQRKQTILGKKKIDKLKATGVTPTWRDYYNAYDVAWRLNNHRVWDVRNEQRATFLARAMLSGKDYRTVEPRRKENGSTEHIFWVHVVPKVCKMVYKYGYKFKRKDTTGCAWTEEEVKQFVLDWLGEPRPWWVK